MPTAHSLDGPQVAENLKVDAAMGLDTPEASRRLAENGPNVLTNAKPLNPWVLLGEQFRSPLVLLLFGAAALSGFLREWIDASAIAVIVILNALIGFFQEYRAEQSIAALKKMTAPLARVLRAGHSITVPAEEVVTGDILMLEPGDLVAADARLLQSYNLRVQEAALTGESEATAKDATVVLDALAPLGDRVNLVFMGTHVVVGTAKAVVTATGMQTEIGHIARMLEAEVRENTPLQKQLAGFGRWILWICLGLVGLVVGLGVLRSVPFLELFLTSVSLAVAAVPEGLPAVVTIAMALGVKRMARNHALIRRLPSVETLGSTQVICTDKTGTLTRGEMSVREVYAGGDSFKLEAGRAVLLDGGEPDSGQSESLSVLAGIHVACNSADLRLVDGESVLTGDPTETALLAASKSLGVEPVLYAGEDPLHEYPFDSDTKRRGMFRPLNRTGGSAAVRLNVNGAPDVLLGLCAYERSGSEIRPLTDERRAEILGANAAMAEKALRVLGSAYRDFEMGVELDREVAENDLVFCGLAGIQDPPRVEAGEAIARCKDAGIRVVMITGDHPRTALAIARELGLLVADLDGEAQVMTGVEVDAADSTTLQERVRRTSVFARVTAEHKLRIVNAWQANGAIVAMTGDGVNDAPALKGADIGIAMGRTGTEVTKQAADMVLANDNFASIVAAVEEGRGVYFNIRKTLQYLLAGNAGELLVMILALAWGWPAPLLAVHLLWINLVTDGLPALVLAADRADASLMKRRPRPAGASLTDGPFLLGLLGTGLMTAGVSLTAFWIGLRSGGIDVARSYAFDTLVLSEVFRALAYQSDVLPFWRTKWRRILPLGITVVFALALQYACHEILIMEKVLRLVPWTVESFALMFGLSLIPLAGLELKKVLFKPRLAA